ncbi:hypothetical protein niasHT_024410 [Heterodera trifolii]|uniref:Uncharacterized protein n=1 Tax=Heterodera trifolii TaxID=157864 RepID=A0ABD2JYC8_9BILA
MLVAASKHSNGLKNDDEEKSPPPIHSAESHQNVLLMPTNSSCSLNGRLLADMDMDGGTLLSVEESEEIDPEDGCKVQVCTYHILSADQTEESTITKRRKLKVNCTQSLKRVEYSNGKEREFEEKTVLDDLSTFLTNDEQHENGKNGTFENVLLRTHDSFLLLLREKKEALIKMFPELFSNLRSMPAIFELLPSTVMETIVNEDGSTTTRTKSSKAFSSRYTRHETFVNGVRQECTTRFRAFMEYAGPDGGFCIRLNNNADKDLSEDEGIDLEEDTRSRISRSSLSEIPDTQSALVVIGKQGMPLLVDQQMVAKRHEKAWHAVTEMVESEARYVQKLALLEKFRDLVERARVLDKRQLGQMFANIASLHQFHEQHLLPQLMDRHREWQSSKKISDVWRKQAPFLKMYSEYTNNYKAAIQMFEESMRRKRNFEELVKRAEQWEECEHLSMVSHLICPVQRVMRYQLLLREYQRHLSSTDPDWEDTDAALSLVLEAASHANEMMRKLDRYRSVLEVQELLGNCISLVTPTRELLTKARLWKCTAASASGSTKTEERWLFVFNDLLLLASDRSAFIRGTTGAGKCKLRAIFAAKHTQICEGDSLEREHSFYLRGSDSPQGPQRCVELCCASQAEKDALFDIVWKVIHQETNSKNSAETLAKNTNNNSSNTEQQQQNKSCAHCDTDFGWYTRPLVCQRCQQRFCKRCFGQRRKEQKMCLDCLRTAEGYRSFSEGVPSSMAHSDGIGGGGIGGNGISPQTRRNLLQIPASSSNDTECTTIKASYVSFCGPSGKQMQRFFVLRRNFCLYSYQTDKDKCALAMLPVSGCDIAINQNEKFGFTVRHAHRTYWVTCFNESDHVEWMAALLLSANAKLPGEGDADESGGGGGEGHNHGMQQRNNTNNYGGRSTRSSTICDDLREAAVINSPRPKPSFCASNPFSGLIVRRSASMGDARIRQMTAHNRTTENGQNEKDEMAGKKFKY